MGCGGSPNWSPAWCGQARGFTQKPRVLSGYGQEAFGQRADGALPWHMCRRREVGTVHKCAKTSGFIRLALDGGVWLSQRRHDLPWFSPLPPTMFVVDGGRKTRKT